MKITNIFWILALILIAQRTSAQQNTAFTKTNLFEKRCFIENLGQFDEHAQGNDSKILYGSYTKGVNIFFTNKGIVYCKLVKAKKSRKELKADAKRLRDIQKKNGVVVKEDDEDEKYPYKLKPIYQEMVWQGANHNPKVKVENQTEGYYSYAVPKKVEKAKGYSKLTYFDIYPNIDVVFYFPQDSAGFKFNYIVKKGGNSSLIKEKWLGNAEIIEQFNGDALIKTPIGNFIAKEPVSYNSDNGEKIPTPYSALNNTISYLHNFYNVENFVIDPWTVTPAFTAGTTAFDVDFDVADNAYVYGGSSNFEILKYNSAGVFQWSYAPFTSGGLYGDFAVDQNTGSVYAINAVGDPNVIKISAAGTFVADHFGSAAMNEMWRIAFSSCSNEAVIAGGGTGGTEAMCYLDTNLVGMTTVDVLGATPGECCFDMVLLTVDNYGYCYFLHADNTVYVSGHENKIVKSPVPGFLPLVYSVPSGHKYQEISGVDYVFTNGFNGITLGDQTIYTYDSYSMKKWSASTGACLMYKKKNSPTGGDSLHKDWGGITADECKNVFIGSRDTVFQYDSNLVYQTFYPMPGTVIDLRIANDGILYVTGDGFLMTMNPTGLIACGSPINPNLNVIDQTCYTLGSATVSPTGGQGPYIITWNTVPVQTGTSAIDLPAGTYTVTISDASCNTNTATTSFTISTAPGGYSTGIITQNISCNGLTDGSISLTPSGGIAPYTYAWDTLGLTSSSATGLGAGTYGILITDSAGCLNNLTVTIIEPLPIVASTNAGILACNGDVGNIVCFPSAGTGPYSVVWNTSPAVTNDTLYNASAGIYSITVTDSMGCSMTFTDTLLEPTALNVNLTTLDVSCDGTVLGSITASVTGGSGPYSYSWSNNPLDSTNVNAGLAAGVYTLVVTDNNSCTFTISDTIFMLTFPTITFNSVLPCNGGTNGTITAVPTGGTLGAVFTYSWNTSPIQTGLVANNVGAGSYILSVQSAGCTFTFPVTIGENPIIDTLSMTAVICGSNTTSTIFLPGIAQPAYQWYLSSVLLPTQTGSVYNAANADIPLVTATWFYGGCRFSSSNTVTTTYPIAKTGDIPNVFSPNGDLVNNLFYAFTFISSTDPTITTGLFDEFSLQIFNRWGQLLFETNDPNKGWNGKDSGNTDVTAGVYFVVLKYKALCADKKGEIIYNGTVQLVR